MQLKCTEDPFAKYFCHSLLLIGLKFYDQDLNPDFAIRSGLIFLKIYFGNPVKY